MRNKVVPIIVLTVLLMSICLLSASSAEQNSEVYPTAILSIQERGTGVKDYGGKIADLLFTYLSAKPNLIMVERSDIQKLLEEHELNLSGMVTSGQATQVGQLTGAKILITGSVFEVDRSLYITAKLIGTETSRVLGEQVKGRTTDDLGTLTNQLADRLNEVLTKHANKLVAPQVSLEDQIAALKKKLGDSPRPTVMVKISERHVGQATVDPAAQTELILFCKGTGFEVLDEASGDNKKAEVTIVGEGCSEFATRRGNLVSVKARLEVKATDQNGRIIAVERQTAVVVDLTEQLAGKTALQQTASAIARRLLPKITAKK